MLLLMRSNYYFNNHHLKLNWHILKTSIIILRAGLIFPQQFTNVICEPKLSIILNFGSHVHNVHLWIPSKKERDIIKTMMRHQKCNSANHFLFIIYHYHNVPSSSFPRHSTVGIKSINLQHEKNLNHEIFIKSTPF